MTDQVDEAFEIFKSTGSELALNYAIRDAVSVYDSLENVVKLKQMEIKIRKNIKEPFPQAIIGIMGVINSFRGSYKFE
ncbi:hypothetical protein A3K64_01595 [Candidatus Micrarchaeota archaeon RBG_16_36_9]|nr:MAG: hypothetical protein A3K64_01595 [Candidatus Micrarchaeota archaeon RBG_16_36_9]